MTALVLKPKHVALNLYNYVTRKFVVSGNLHSVPLPQFASSTCSRVSWHHFATDMATYTRLYLSVTSIANCLYLPLSCRSIRTLCEHMNYPYIFTCSQAIRGRPIEQEDPGCVSVEHVGLLNTVLLAKPDVSFTKLAPTTWVYVSYHWDTYFYLTIGYVDQTCFYEE